MIVYLQFMQNECFTSLAYHAVSSKQSCSGVKYFSSRSTKRLNGHVVKSESISSVSPEALVAPGSDVNMYQPPDISEDEGDY